jgi:putative oxygen-independent coproporphyrinogen III oxidase
MQPAAGIADTLYFGGGTPSLTSPEVLGLLKSKFRLEKEAEITLEANPDDVTSDSLSEWKKLGITRISLGIQSLEEGVLRKMNRVHSASEALQAVRQARLAGFDNLNLDLMIGVPDQSENGFLDGVRKLIECKPSHFSLYFLELHEHTELYRQIQSGKIGLMQEQLQIRCYTEAVRLLQEAGFDHYEVSNFALTGKASRHNLKYWNGSSYYAYGVGACSYVELNRINNISTIERYIEMVNKNELPIESIVSEDKEMQMRNSLIFGLRKRQGVDTGAFEKTYGISPLTLFPDAGNTLLEGGMLEISGPFLRLTFNGMLVSNEILSQVI